MSKEENGAFLKYQMYQSDQEKFELARAKSKKRFKSTERRVSVPGSTFGQVAA
jgi:hypothetical protein